MMKRTIESAGLRAALAMLTAYVPGTGVTTGAQTTPLGRFIGRSRRARYSWSKPHDSKRARVRRCLQALRGELSMDEFITDQHYLLAVEKGRKIAVSQAKAEVERRTSSAA